MSLRIDRKISHTRLRWVYVSIREHQIYDALRSALVTSGVLVKTCIASTKVYIKLESLIMAQNERWRQA